MAQYYHRQENLRHDTVIHEIHEITLGLTCPPGIRILFLLEDSAFKYTPSYDELKLSSLSRLRNHSLNIKCQLKPHS